MNIVLTERYLCRKLQRADSLYGMIAESVGTQALFCTALNTRISRLDPEFIKWHRKVIERKFKLNPNRKLLFPAPTLRQWVFDLAGEYQPDDIMDFFSQSSGASIAMLRNSNIDDTVFARPFLIDLVEQLEAATGKMLNNPKEMDFPLRYLGNVTYVDLADYFSLKGSDRIDAIRRTAGLA